MGGFSLVPFAPIMSWCCGSLWWVCFTVYLSQDVLTQSLMQVIQLHEGQHKNLNVLCEIYLMILSPGTKGHSLRAVQ